MVEMWLIRDGALPFKILKLVRLCNVFLKKNLLCSRLHLFNQKYSHFVK